MYVEICESRRSLDETGRGRGEREGRERNGRVYTQNRLPIRVSKQSLTTRE